MEPIIFGSQNPTWFMALQSLGSFLGIVIIAVITWIIANRRIKAQFELKKEEINLIKTRFLLEKKLDILKDLENLSENFTTLSSKNLRPFSKQLISVRNSVQSYVTDNDLIKVLQRGIDELHTISKITLGDEEIEKSEKSYAIIYVTIHSARRRMSDNIGFKRIHKGDTLESIDKQAEDMIKRSKKYD